MLYKSPFLEVLESLNPNHEVCHYRGKRLLAQELIDQSTSLAVFLANQGLERGSRVLFACDLSQEFLVLFVALLHLRAKVALIDPHMGNALYKAKIDQFQPQHAFIDSRMLLLQEHPILRFIYRKTRKKALYIPYSKAYETWATGMKLPLLQKHRSIRNYKSTPGNFQTASQDDEVVLVYTSGTLAEPKAVVQTVDSLYESLRAISQVIGREGDQIMATHLAHFALLGAMSGFRTMFWKEGLSAKKKIAFIEQHGITSLFGPPAEFLPLLEFCLQAERKLPNSLQHIILGSAPVRVAFLRKLREYTTAKITCLYGMTENLVVAAIDGDEKIQAKVDGDLLGKPVEGVNFLMEEDGELLIQSPMLYKRYYHLENRDAYHATGDVVKLDEKGRLIMKARKKNMIIRGDKNIYPGLYEPIIESIPSVHEAIMVGIYDDQRFDEQVYLVIDGVDGLKPKDIYSQLKSGPYQIDSDAIPDEIVFMSIPRKGRQWKVDYEALKLQISNKQS